MKIFNIILIYLLFFSLLYTRISSRILNPLWIDEVEVLKNMHSLHYITFQYLPSIPGGYPGFYYLIYIVNLFFKDNYFLLGLPGLISHVGVFLLLPKIIFKTFDLKAKNLNLIVLVSRIGFVFDPTLSFQAMELRPYTFLPFMWVLIFFITSHLYEKIKKRQLNLGDFIIFCLLYVVIFIWHFYGFFMTLSVFLFFTLKEKIKLSKLKKTSLLIIFSTLVSIPFWLFFSRGSFRFHFNTFEWFNTNILTIYLFNQGTMRRSMYQQIIFLILFILVILLIVRFFYRWIEGTLTIFLKKELIKVVVTFFILVGFPSVIIFFLDLLNNYWFLLRQISWTLIPFYCCIGYCVYLFYLSNKRNSE